MNPPEVIFVVYNHGEPDMAYRDKDEADYRVEYLAGIHGCLAHGDLIHQCAVVLNG